MKFDKVIEIIEKIAPPECGENWDNSGVQEMMILTKYCFALKSMTI